MYPRYLLFLFLFLAAMVVGAQRQLAVAAVPEMAEEIYQAISTLHPFASTLEGAEALGMARTQVQGELDKALSGKDSITYLAFVGLVSPLQEATGCGHLLLEPHYDSLTTQALRENRFLLSAIQLANNDYVLRNGLRTTTDSLPPGTTLLSINQAPVGPLFASLAPFSGHNDQNWQVAPLTRTARWPSYAYQSYYGLQDSLSIAVVTDLGDTLQRVIKPIHQPYVDFKEEKTDIEQTLSFRFSDSGQTGILQIRKFSSYQFNNGNYFRFIRQVFDTLAVTETKRLIIDIRSNGGGSSNRINYLNRYLADKKFRFASAVRITGPAWAEAGEDAKTASRRVAGAVSRKERKIQRRLTAKIKPASKKYRYQGEVVVLIDEVSFSASGIFARYVQGSGRGRLVGVVSGASAGVTYGASGEKDPIYLGPDDNLELKVNTMSLTPEFPLPGNVTPDLIVLPTLAGIKAGKDEVMETALKLLAD